MAFHLFIVIVLESRRAPIRGRSRIIWRCRPMAGRDEYAGALMGDKSGLLRALDRRRNEWEGTAPALSRDGAKCRSREEGRCSR
ncbi:hypothetical protein CEXT_406631 [Caerostris extrusa]|uniref:Uncharacterized protein n=1 Tax=Caerostris extrusa TaxID=172846 RepID=A0AAV4RZR0_CAEEX|nr:hypothetical protein CEXT_406631 [Caerostris extrusa]